MKTSIIKIGNSRGVRIPKLLLEETGLGKDIELRIEGEKIIIEPYKKTKKAVKINEEYMLSLNAFKDWDTPEEDEAWAYLQ